uniref:Kazal-like domain-containing protein n=1 Tax=Erpetoichthys calabaricus TaxID=27687 RepID=A0A8C4TF45_ERPCA
FIFLVILFFTSYLTLLQNFCHKYITHLDCPIAQDFICGDDGNSYQNECHLGFEYLPVLIVSLLNKVLQMNKKTY